MKATELMIGDWVIVRRQSNLLEKVRVKSVIGNGTIEAKTRDGLVVFGELAVEPIPLTGEILEKSGFNASDVSLHYIKYVCSTGPIDEFADIVLICGKDNKDKWRWDCLDLRIHYYRGDIHQFKINYVHELQHAMRLCGVEKDMEI